MQLQQSMDHYNSAYASHKLTGAKELGQILISTKGKVTGDKLLYHLPSQIIRSFHLKKSLGSSTGNEA